MDGLEGKEHQESNHDAEQAHGFGESKAENCVREQLSLQRRVS